MDLALCKNEECPSKGHCYRFTAEPSCHQVYAQFAVRPKEEMWFMPGLFASRCEYYIPSKINDVKE